MRIVNSSRLWDKPRSQKLSPALWLFVITIITGFVIAAGIIAAIELRQDLHIRAKAAGISEPKVNNVSAMQTKILTGVFYLERDNLDILLMNKLFPPPPAKPSLNCAMEACLALTFDDGPDPITTPAILDALKAVKAHATFFLVGMHVVKNPALTLRIATEGHEIGNHSFSHTDFTKLTSEQIRVQIDQTQNAVIAAGAPAPKTFRPPYEKINNNVKTDVHMPIVLWNIDPKDWKQTNPSTLVQLVESQAKPGSIIILHDMHPVTAAAINTIVQKLSTRFKLVTVSELLNLHPYSKGVFFSQR